MLQKLLRLYDNWIDIVGGRIRNEKLRELKQYCINQGLSHYPELLWSLPKFAHEVNNYIIEHANKELPIAQFEGKTNPYKLEDFVEIGGVLGFNDELFEIAYSGSNTSTVIKRSYGDYGGFTIIPMIGEILIPQNEIDSVDNIISWHSHPVGFGEPSNGDIKDVQEILEVIGGNNFYFIIFQPEKIRSFWYQFKKPFK